MGAALSSRPREPKAESAAPASALSSWEPLEGAERLAYSVLRERFRVFEPTAPANGRTGGASDSSASVAVVGNPVGPRGELEEPARIKDFLRHRLHLDDTDASDALLLLPLVKASDGDSDANRERALNVAFRAAAIAQRGVRISQESFVSAAFVSYLVPACAPNLTEDAAAERVLNDDARMATTMRAEVCTARARAHRRSNSAPSFSVALAPGGLPCPPPTPPHSPPFLFRDAGHDGRRASV